LKLQKEFFDKNKKVNLKNLKSKIPEKKRKKFKIKKTNFCFSEKKEHWLNLPNEAKNNLREF